MFKNHMRLEQLSLEHYSQKTSFPTFEQKWPR